LFFRVLWSWSTLSLTYRKFSIYCLLAFFFQLFSALLFVQCICRFIFKIITPASYYICLFYKIFHTTLNPLLYFSQLFLYTLLLLKSLQSWKICVYPFSSFLCRGDETSGDAMRFTPHFTRILLPSKNKVVFLSDEQIFSVENRRASLFVEIGFRQ
jgi:hypothetical protein